MSVSNVDQSKFKSICVSFLECVPKLAELGLPKLSEFIDEYQNWVDHIEVEVTNIAELKSGDILSRRLYGVSRHTAVYVGEGYVIHISGGDSKEKGEKKLRLEPLYPSFVKEGKTFFKVIFSEPVRSKERIALAAVKTLLKEEWGNYHLVKNNCQHFATFCALRKRSVIEVKAKILYGVILLISKIPGRY